MHLEGLAVADAQLRHGVGLLTTHDRVDTDGGLDGGSHVGKLVSLTVRSDAGLSQSREEAFFLTKVEGGREITELVLETSRWGGSVIIHG